MQIIATVKHYVVVAKWSDGDEDIKSYPTRQQAEEARRNMHYVLGEPWGGYRVVERLVTGVLTKSEIIVKSTT